MTFMTRTVAQSNVATAVGVGRSIWVALMVCLLVACGGGSSNGTNTGNTSTGSSSSSSSSGSSRSSSGCSSSSSSSGANPTVSLKSVEVTPANTHFAAGTSIQLSATAIYSDGTFKDVTGQVTWSSSNTAVASVSNASATQGVAAALAPGSVTLSAAFNGETGSSGVTVTAAELLSIEVTPPAPSVANGLKLQLTATGIFSDHSTQDLTRQVSWMSSNTTVASISDTAGSNGLINTVAVGNTTVTATSGSITGSTTLTISAAVLSAIEVTPASPSAPKGVQEQLAATGIFSDNSKQDLTTQVTWSSSNGDVAVVSNVAGTVGLVKNAGGGAATIFAALNGVTGSTTVNVTAATLVSVQVTPVNPSIANGLTEQLIATGTYSDNSTQNVTMQATWSSSNASLATVSNAAGSQGLASSTGLGVTSISASVGGISGSTNLTVSAAVLASIQVTPANPSIASGLTQQFTATGTYTDNSTQNLTTQVTWSSSNASVATVSNATGSQGLASSAGLGVTVVSATSGNVSGSSRLTVTAATLVSIQVTPANPSLANGLTQQLTATGTYTDNSTQNLTTQVTWSSSNASVATVSNAGGSQGLASSAALGNTTIAATSGGASGSTTLTVTAAALVSIQVTPSDPMLSDGLTRQLTATGTFTDNSTQDVTTQVTWASADAAVAIVSNATGSQGLVTAVGLGNVTISATRGGVSGSTSVTDSNGWTWAGGSSTVNTSGIYGTLGTATSGNGPGARANAATWTDAAGNLWLFGGQGYDSQGTFDLLNDLWKYSPSTKQWTWVGGSNTVRAAGVYGPLGVPGARAYGAAWTDAAGHFWLFGGSGFDSNGTAGQLSDLWMYDPATGVWTWVNGSSTANSQGYYPMQQGVPIAGSYPGGRYAAVGWADSAGHFWVFGGSGFDSNGIEALLNDLWMFDPSLGLWSWEGGSNTGRAQGVYGTQGTASASNVPGARTNQVGWVDRAGNFWLFGGDGYDSTGALGAINDLWTYSPSTHLWTWVSGSDTINATANYGTEGTPAVSNIPGARYYATSWTDKTGNLWLFGGVGAASGGSAGTLSDLWMYSPATGLWTWVSGSNGVNVPGSYGSGVGNGVPGAREVAMAWGDSAGNLWLFGGAGYDSTGHIGYLSDLWEY